MATTHRWFIAASPAGPAFVAHHDGRVSGLLIAGDKGKASGVDDFIAYMRNEVGADVVVDPDPDLRLVAQVHEALAQSRTDVPVDLSSRSSFHQQVLRAAVGIPKGEVRTYSELASAVGRPKAARAVGQAMARNPVSLLVPCHRVVPSSGDVGNYGYGPDLKRELLAREGVIFSERGEPLRDKE